MENALRQGNSSIVSAMSFSRLICSLIRIQKKKFALKINSPSSLEIWRNCTAGVMNNVTCKVGVAVKKAL